MKSGMIAEHSALERVLDTFPDIAVAVSGGVDSLTLATFAHRYMPDRTGIFHAISPAVPAAATRRVRSLAEAEGWNLRIVDAQEFADTRYRSNPVNRCFYCKSHLYQAIAGCTRAKYRKNNRYFSQAGQPIESRQTALNQLTTIIPTICSGQARPDRINFLLYQSSRLTAAPPHPHVQIVCHATSCFQSNGPTYGGARHGG
jgi:hypothetical protein